METADLNTLSRRDLQAIAKDLGIKANMKSSMMIEQIEIARKENSATNSPSPRDTTSPKPLSEVPAADNVGSAPGSDEVVKDEALVINSANQTNDDSSNSEDAASEEGELAEGTNDMDRTSESVDATNTNAVTADDGGDGDLNDLCASVETLNVDPLRQFVAINSDHWCFLDDGRLLCRLTGHEMVAREEEVAAYACGKKFRAALMEHEKAKKEMNSLKGVPSYQGKVTTFED